MELCDGLLWPYFELERSVWDELGVVGKLRVVVFCLWQGRRDSLRSWEVLGPILGLWIRRSWLDVAVSRGREVRLGRAWCRWIAESRGFPMVPRSS